MSFRGAGASPRTRNPDANPAFFPDFRVRSADASAPQCQRLVLRKFQPHGAIALGILAPAFAHLDEQEQVHLGLGRLGDLLARRLPDRLDGGAAFAEHDLALALALDIDRLLDADVALAQLLP